MNTVTWSRFGLLLAVVPLTTGCMMTREHQAAMDEKDSQIRMLHEERAQLKRELQGARSNLDAAHGELANASARMSAEPAPSVNAPAEKIPELDAVGVGYGLRDGNMVISIPSSITFASGEATLSKEGEKALKSVAALLDKKYPGARYSIEGHTDSDPIKKSKFDSNRELSLARAQAVHAWLVIECGVPDANCVVVGHGEYDPVAANDSKEHKAKNRRVEIVVHKARKP